MKFYGADVETFKIAPGVAFPKLVCLSWDDRAGDSGVVLADEGLEMFRAWVADPDVTLIAHNAPFDIGVMVAEAFEQDGDLRLLKLVFKAIREGRIRCTLIREKILENAVGELKYDWDEDLLQYKKASFSLQRCMWTRCRVYVKKEDTWQKSFGLLQDTPVAWWPPEAREYSLKDSTYGHQLFWKQEEGVFTLDASCPKRPDGTYDVPGEIETTRSAFCLALMSAHGVRTNPEAVKIVEAEFQVEFDKAVKQAREAGLVGVKREWAIRPEFVKQYEWVTRKEDLKKVPKEHKHRVERPKRIMEKIRARVRTIYTARGEDVPLSDSGKNISTDRETLTFGRFPLWEKDKGLMAVAELVRYEKLLTTYVPVLKRGGKWPITPSWNAMVETFRTSCASPNLQNLPRGTSVRDCFIPREGWVYVSADYSTIELCALAQVCLDLFGYSAMAESINAGRDLHVDMAAALLGITYAAAYERYLAGDPEVDEARQFAKIVDFGAPGGMGADAFVEYARGYGIIITREQAVVLLQQFRQKWPEVVDYFAHCGELCDEGGECGTLVHPRTGYVRGRVRYTATCNNGFQHLTAVGAKAALCRVVEESYVDESSPLYGCRPVVFAHDEIIIEVPREAMGAERASAAADHLSRVMVEEMKVFCPDVNIQAGAVMMRRWIKGAKAVRVNGMLVPSRKEGKSWVADLGEDQERRAA